MPNFYYARQPIFDDVKAVFGYELLFRDSIDNFFHHPEGERATLDILSNALFHGSFQDMVGGKYGLVNFPRKLLLEDVIFLFSPDHFVIEVLEDVVPDKEILAACRRLKDAGYKIALDDFVPEDLNNPLLPLVDFVKVDFLQAQGKERKLIADQLLPMGLTLLAEKVETDEDYHNGLDSGYKLFQGYFFSKPVIKSGPRLAPSQVACIRLLQAVFKEQCDYRELNEIVSGDLSLTYRMLRLANSPYFSFQKEITSILHAITLLGCDGMKKFVSLVAIGTSLGNKSPELGFSCLIRAKMGEELAPRIGYAEALASPFLTGLFSSLDALLDCPMNEVVAQLPIAQDVKSALLGQRNILRATLDAIIAYERGDWDQFAQAAATLKLKEGEFPLLYSSAVDWAGKIICRM
jgi:c-di-GMP-related signal transduction protein